MSFAGQGSQTILEAITSRGVHWIGLSPFNPMVYEMSCSYSCSEAQIWGPIQTLELDSDPIQ